MSSTPPVWLREDAELLALLNAVLDRFDQLPGDERQRNVVLPAQTYLRSLARTDAQADQTWALVGELERLKVLKVRAAKRSPYDPEWKDAKLAFAPASESVLRNWLTRQRTEPAMQQWRRAVQAQAAAFSGDCEPLLARRIAIPRRSCEQVIAALASLGTIQTPATLRQLSAFAFWGDSKILDERGDLIAALFPRLSIRERQIVVAIHLPQACDGVLFIENQDTYTAAVVGMPPETNSLALIYAAGFRGAAGRIRTRGGAVLHYAGPGVAAHQGLFEQWWYGNGVAPGPAWFWGDLDFAGMQILKSLRGRFGELTAWQPGYAPMLAQMRSRGGHASIASEEQAQNDPGTTGCAYADGTLLPAIREHGQMDQESVFAASLSS